MDPIRNIKLRWLHGTLGDVTYQLTRVQFARSIPARWQPAINAFRCETAVRICVDLAGVEKSEINLTIEPRRVVVRGVRDVPGEVTLRGLVLPIGGLKEKSLGAMRAGVTTVLFPKLNEKDLVDIPDEAKEKIKFIPVENVDEVLAHALQKGGAAKPSS
jgi:ATP-dependent Lon protease